jgi:adenylate cyclase
LADRSKMQIIMTRRVRLFLFCAIIAIGTAAGARLLSNLRFFQIMNLKALDAHFVLRGAEPSPGVVLVVADQKAIDTFPELRIFWHPYYAEAIRAAGAAGAKVIGLDLAFGIPIDKWEPEFDRLLSEAVSTSPVPVVCGYVSSFGANQEKLPVPINMVSAALGLAAFVNLTEDQDEFFRRQELIEAPAPGDAGAALARSLGLRVVEKYLGADAEFQNGRLMLQGKPIPVAADRSIYINYAGPEDTFPRVSLADVVAASKAGDQARLRGWVQDKIVLIGSDTFDDRYPTPFYTMFNGRRWTTAGVEIHANTVHTLLARNYLTEVPDLARMAALLLATSLTVAVAISVSAGAAAVWLAVEALFIILITHLLFRAGMILSTSEILVGTLLCLIASIVYRFWTAERRGNLFSRAVSLFVGRRVAESLADTERIRLFGSREVLTILFTDIRGFTAFSEQFSETDGPEALVHLLNQYMELMVAIIMKHHGQVNKFIGDGILAIFSDNDPGATPGDHPIRAVRCATEMVSAPNRFETGAGIHTGLVVLGNVGSADKMEYTVLGDPVNLASRIESLNKEHHTRLLMSEATHALLRNEVETTPLGSASVKGKTAAVKLYTVSSLVESPKGVVHA